MKFIEVENALSEGKKIKLKDWDKAYWFINHEGVLMNHFEGGEELPAATMYPKDIMWVITGDWEIVEAEPTFETFDFSVALDNLKKGKKVARIGWNVKGMFLVLTKGNEVPADNMRVKSVKRYYKNVKQDTVKIAPHIDLKAADNTYVTGWLASQTDLLANDWIIVD